MDEIFGAERFVAQINFKATSPLGQKGIAKVYDYLIWYAKNPKKMTFNNVFGIRDISSDKEWRFVAQGHHFEKVSEEKFTTLPDWDHVFRRSKLTSSGFTASCIYDFDFQGNRCKPFGGKSWGTTKEGMELSLIHI